MKEDKVFDKKELKKRSENLSDWYTDVVLKAELADYGPAKGTMVIRPYGYAIWEQIQEIFNKWIKAYGVENAYFPLFIPMSLFEKEKDHIKGFSPELAVVTHGGGKKLAEPLVVRPTSETIMYHMYKKWVNSHRDLPILINQWNNVVRWEMRTYLFLRTSEFLWQEGHTAHKDENEAQKMQLQALEWYRKLYEEYLAIPVVVGEKSQTEKFAGAKSTYSVEALMPDGKALQAGTSHNLGTNFSEVFDIAFQAEDGKRNFVWQTSWGLSTRSLGGLFLTHGDDNGLLLPPKIAPIQVVIIPINNDEGINATSQAIKTTLEDKGLRVKLDNRDYQSMGRKINYWELKGVPVRLEIGKKEVESNTITYVRRDTLAKLQINNDSKLGDEIQGILDNVQVSLFERAKSYLANNTRTAETYDEFKEIMKTKRGFIKVYWEESKESEDKIKEETKATPRVKLLGHQKPGKCFLTGKPTQDVWYFAQSY